MERATIDRYADVRQSQIRGSSARHLDPDELDGAIGLARGMILERQKADGSWQERGDMGPITTALSLVCLRHVGQLRADELHEGTRWLRSRQLEDGSFVGRPFASAGDLSLRGLREARRHAVAPCRRQTSDSAVVKGPMSPRSCHEPSAFCRSRIMPRARPIAPVSSSGSNGAPSSRIWDCRKSKSRSIVARSIGVMTLQASCSLNSQLLLGTKPRVDGKQPNGEAIDTDKS